jgi:hypothetical protein
LVQVRLYLYRKRVLRERALAGFAETPILHELCPTVNHCCSTR